uniref:TEA domain-containing protein n=1 Tax=Acrobeloides nanus TaxID=290746 RepID=A0A914ENL4_9BILA
MTCVRTLSTINEEEDDEIWPPEVEVAVREALLLYPSGKRKIKQNGKIFGRNSLISMYIEKKCGKTRTNDQIASHLQVLKLKRAKLEKLQKHVVTKCLIAPEVFRNELLGLTDFGAVKFLQLKENHNTERYFTDTITFLSNIFDILSYRRVSGEKLAFLAVLIYTHEPNEYTNLIYSNTISRGFTCITDSIIPEIKLSEIQHNFGKDLIDLYQRSPKSAFYCVKSWNNFYYPKSDHAEVIWDSIFYSKYLLDIKDESTCYLMGQPIYTGFVEHMAVDQIVLGSEKYYIYRARSDKNYFIQNKYSKRLYAGFYLKMMKHFVDKNDVETIRVITRNQARLIVLTDMNTQEVLLVLACINDYMPDFTGYQYFRIVL